MPSKSRYFLFEEWRSNILIDPKRFPPESNSNIRAWLQHFINLGDLPVASSTEDGTNAPLGGKDAKRDSHQCLDESVSIVGQHDLRSLSGIMLQVNGDPGPSARGSATFSLIRLAEIGIIKAPHLYGDELSFPYNRCAALELFKGDINTCLA